MLLTAVLIAPPSDDAWVPAEAPPLTPWARAGARGWRLCQDAERQARIVRSGGGARGLEEGDPQRWQRQAETCPHAVEVLTLAAQNEIVDAGRLFRHIDTRDEFGEADVDARPVEQIIEEHRTRIEQALVWLDTAIAESGRRGDRPPREARYYRAYALTALGRVEDARLAIDEAMLAGDVERWRAQRMAALILLFAGDVQTALRWANRGVVEASASDRAISRYIRALVLDRAGAPAAARAELVAMQRDGSAAFARMAMESVLPVHELLFFRALDHQANGNQSAALRMWETYLRRPEPADPERVLARRHLEELTPTPAPIGGP